MPKVDNEHPLYTEARPFWQKMRDCIGGEDVIKTKDTAYLPVPPGLQADNKSPEYQNYKTRARFPEMVAPAVEGMVGLMGRKLNEPELPPAMKYLYDEATPDGLSLLELESRIRHEVCSMGRFCLFVDVPEEGGNPYIATYPAESVINWRGDADRLTLVVFYEEIQEADPVDTFVTITIPQWREASIEVNEDTGREQYVVRVWREDNSVEKEHTKHKQFYIEEEFFPTIRGESLSFVPVVIMGSRDLMPEPDAIPLIGAANKSLHYYRQYADYALQLFMSANGTTPYGTGIAKDDIPKVIGPATFWSSEAPDATFGFAEITGAGLASQKEELENIKAEIAYATVRVLGDKKAAEAAETLRLRFQSQTATLNSIAKACGSGLRRSLRFCALWLGANEDDVKVTTDVEFISEQPDPQLMKILYDGVEKGFMPEELLIEYTRRVELHDMDSETFRAWAPFFMGLGSGEEDE